MFVLGPNGPEEVPPEFMAQITKSNDLHSMAIEEAQLTTEDLLESLTSERLATLARMFETAASGNNSYGIYMVGFIKAMLRIKFDVCPACGKKHDEVF